MLEFINCQNYKNITDRFDFTSLNILIGSNGSGKSNLISYLQFLKYCLTPISDENRGVTSFEDAVSKLGSVGMLDNYTDSPARISLTYAFGDRSNDNPKHIVLEFEILIDKDQFKMNIVSEKLYLDFRQEQPFYCYQFHNREIGKGVISIYDNQKGKHSFKFLEQIPTNILSLQNLPKLLEENISNNSEDIPNTNALSSQDETVYKIRRDLLEIINNWQFYNANNMNLSEIRKAEPKIGARDIYLSSSGDNLPLVLENLIAQDIDFEDKINEAMKSILPQTRKIRPVRSGRLSLTVEWYVEGTKEPFYLSEMSDGTVRMLCWAIILYSPVLPSLLVIDEPEAGLHVAWLKILAEWIKRASQKTQIIITTHSPDLLDGFTDCLENVICLYSDDRKHFTGKYLQPQMLQSKLEEGWELGDLYRIGDPSVGGWPW
jgi:predicted ATPase